MNIRTETRFDRAAIRATRTPQGYVVDTPVVTRAGIFPYLRADGSVRREYRPPEVVFDERTLAAMNGIPVTRGHVSDLSADTIGDHMIGAVVSAGRRDGDDVVAEVRIYRGDALAGGHRELSLGYRVDVDDTPGEIDGERYDSRLVAITEWDHLALVNKGRAGNARLNMDAAELATPDAAGAQPATPHPSQDTTRMDGMTDVRLDSGIAYKAAPEVANELTRLRQRADALQADMKIQRDRADAAQAKADGLDDAITKARADGATAARARFDLEAVAQRLGVQIRADDTDRAVREAVVSKVRGKPIDFSTRADAYVDAAFDQAVEIADERSRNAQRAEMHRPVAGARSDVAETRPLVTAADARAQMIRGMKSRKEA